MSSDAGIKIPLESTLRNWWHMNMHHGETSSEMIKSLLGSLDAAGFAIVPKHPTRKMLEACLALDDDYTDTDHIYVAMVAAANNH